MAEQRWVGGVAAAAVAAFADMTGETAGAVATQRPRVVRAVRGSVETTAQIAVQMTDGLLTAPVWPATGNASFVSAQNSPFLDDSLNIVVPGGWRLQWTTPTVGAFAREIAVLCEDRSGS